MEHVEAVLSDQVRRFAILGVDEVLLEELSGEAYIAHSTDNDICQTHQEISNEKVSAHFLGIL